MRATDTETVFDLRYDGCPLSSFDDANTYGQSFKDKILVFPGAKGSSGWSAAFHLARLTNSAPKAMIFNEMTTKIALGAVVTRAPSVTGLDRDPLTVIETGDWVKVDADRGLVEVIKKR
jgi:hypothetical protein